MSSASGLRASAVTRVRALKPQGGALFKRRYSPYNTMFKVDLAVGPASERPVHSTPSNRFAAQANTRPRGPSCPTSAGIGAFLARRQSSAKSRRSDANAQAPTLVPVISDAQFEGREAGIGGGAGPVATRPPPFGPCSGTSSVKISVQALERQISDVAISSQRSFKQRSQRSQRCQQQSMGSQEFVPRATPLTGSFAATCNARSLLRDDEALHSQESTNPSMGESWSVRI